MPRLMVRVVPFGRTLPAATSETNTYSDRVGATDIRLWLLALVWAFIVLLIMFSTPLASAAAVQRQCGAPSLPACPGPPPMAGEWKWGVVSPFVIPPPENFHSDAEIYAYYENYISSTYTTRLCGPISNAGMTAPSQLWGGEDPRYQFGILFWASHASERRTSSTCSTSRIAISRGRVLGAINTALCETDRGTAK